MPYVSFNAAVESSRPVLAERLKPRLEVEDYFRRSGRTFRKGRLRLWFNIHVKTALLRLMFRAAGIYRRGMRNAISLEVKRIPLQLPSLPEAFEGYRVLHLSDFHIDGVDGLAEHLEPILRELRPDLCVLTGDYRFEINGPCTDVYPRMRKVISSIHASDGLLATLGNHDAAEMAFQFEAMGVRMLVNEAVQIRRGGESIWVSGLDDQFDYRCANLPLALESIPRNSFVVLLAHDPQLFEAAEQSGVALYLCGHTHAGQIRLPLIGAVKKNAPVPRRLVQGAWRYKGMQGYTSWGAGSSTMPVRYNCPPEIAVLELRRHVQE